MGSTFANRALPTQILLVTVAIAAGLFIPYYVSALNDRPIALVLLPLAIVGGAIFFADRKWLLLAILLTRAGLEVVLEATRGSGMGLGAALNAGVILIALALIIEKPASLPRFAFSAWVPFFAAAALGVLLAPDKTHALRLCLTWVTNLAIFASAFFLVHKREDFRFVLKIIIWSSVLPVIYGLAELAMYGGGAGPDGRLQSTFTHPNVYAFYLVLVIAVCLTLFKCPSPSHNAGGRTALGMYVLMLLAQLMLTQTRAAWLACFALLVAYAVKFDRRYLVYMLLCLPLALASPVVRERLLDLFSVNVLPHYSTLDSWSWRLELWSAALSSFEWQRLFTGYGIGAFREHVPFFFSRSGGVNWDAHNVYVQWFYDVGLFGLVTYVWVHLYLLRKTRPLAQQDSSLAFMVRAIIIGYLIVSVSDNMMDYLAFNWYYWLLLGAACALASLPREGQEPAYPSRTGVVRWGR